MLSHPVSLFFRRQAFLFDQGECPSRGPERAVSIGIFLFCICLIGAGIVSFVGGGIAIAYGVGWLR